MGIPRRCQRLIMFQQPVPLNQWAADLAVPPLLENLSIFPWILHHLDPQADLPPSGVKEPAAPVPHWSGKRCRSVSARSRVPLYLTYCEVSSWTLIGLLPPLVFCWKTWWVCACLYQPSSPGSCSDSTRWNLVCNIGLPQAGTPITDQKVLVLLMGCWVFDFFPCII